MNTIRLNAYAKLNLTLDITGIEAGYHMLDSLVTTVNLCDRVVAKKRKDKLISIRMHGMGSESIPPEHNHAQRAAEAFVEAFDTRGADITIYKNIPIGAGLGGSSADAAGVLNALSRLYEADDFTALKALADRVGSDTGYLLNGGFCRMTGRGETVEPLGACPQLFFLLLCPQSGVSTAECYKKADTYPRKLNNATEKVLALMREGKLKEAAAQFSNDLFDAAKTLNSDVEKALEEAKSFAPLGACMTGSGSGVFALFETEELCRWAKSRYRGRFRALCVKATEPQEKRIANPFVLEENEDGREND